MNACMKWAAPFLGTLFWAGTAPQAAAQSAYPVKTVQLIVPYTAGGGADVVMRAVAQRLAEAWGRNVIVEIVPAPAA